MPRRVLLGQFGGPTAVLNASLFGAWAELQAAGAEVWAVRGGPRGLAAGDLRPLGGPPPAWLCSTPGAALGAGRQLLEEGELEAVVADLRRRQVDAVVLAGGNGTMRLALGLEQAAQRRGVDLAVVGVPKTVDNDLEGTDHAPGYPSAATFVARAVHDLAVDLRAMAGFEDVRLVEVMGRRAGWLAAAAALARAHPEDLPQRILLPEVPLDPDAFCREVAELHRRDGSVLVVVAEGVVGPDGLALANEPLDAAGRRRVLGGAARVLAELLRGRLGLAVRAESLGLLPRCLTGTATALDRAEAVALGRRAARVVLGGGGGVMVGLRPRTPGTPPDPPGEGCVEVALRAVAGRERRLPSEMRELGPAFIAWLRPLVDLPPSWPPFQVV
jgi:6-phosphofructokinase